MSTFQTDFDALSEQNEQLKAENERLEMKNKQLSKMNSTYLSKINEHEQNTAILLKRIKQQVDQNTAILMKRIKHLSEQNAAATDSSYLE
jgi:hypothetical protein